MTERLDIIKKMIPEMQLLKAYTFQDQAFPVGTADGTEIKVLTEDDKSPGSPSKVGATSYFLLSSSIISATGFCTV